MSEKNYEFIDIKRIEPETKSLNVRKVDFSEIYEQTNIKKVSEQASRCLGCGNPYCEWRCPLHNYIPDWLKLIEENRLEEAADLCHETNAFPEICGRICPQEKLCEGACTLNTGYEAVTIGQVEKYISDTALEQGWKPKKYSEKQTKFHVSIIGAGPAGLACAETLIRRGINCTVYDKYSEIGGLLTYGIPEFKLEKKVVLKRREILEELGVKFVLNCWVDDKKIKEIETASDAIFLGLGTYESIKGKYKGFDKDGVTEALPYLIKNTNYLMTDSDFEELNFEGQKVVVLGGGDTAMDCVRTAIRQGAKSVKCIYRRSKEHMPGSSKEVKHAEEEGVEFIFNTQPVEVEGNGSVKKLKIVTTKYDENKKSLVEQSGSEKLLDVDRLIVAFGYSASPQDFFINKGVEIDKDGLVKLDRNEYKYQTSNEKFFAGGDMIMGSSLAVYAIAHGRDAAKEIINYLKSN